MSQKRTVLLLKVVLWLSALAPGTWLLTGMFVYPDWVGANPIEKLTHVTGMTTLVLLLVTLSVTPLRRLSGWNPLIRLRRPLTRVAKVATNGKMGTRPVAYSPCRPVSPG